MRYSADFLECLARDRVLALREAAARHAQARIGRPRWPFRIRLGLTLIHVGRWVLRHSPAWGAEGRRLA